VERRVLGGFRGNNSNTLSTPRGRSFPKRREGKKEKSLKKKINKREVHKV